MMSADSASHAPLATAGVTTLAVLVTTGATAYLPEALKAIAAQTTPPDGLLVVDVASRTNGLGSGTPVEEAVDAAGLDAITPVRIIRIPEAQTFVEAVRRGVARHEELLASRRSRREAGASPTSSTARTTGPGVWAAYSQDHAAASEADEAAGTSTQAPASETGSLTRMGSRRARTTTTGIWENAKIEAPTPARTWDTVGADSLPGTRRSQRRQPGVTATWLWLLHDDCAPQPQCLEELTRAVSDARSVQLAGPKQVDWEHPDQLLEVGLRTTASARRANDIIEGEIDQGQYDSRSDVLAVGTAGALIQRQAWDRVSDVAQTVGRYADGLTLSHALRRSGGRVIVVPRAIVRHRRAGLEGLRHVAADAEENARSADDAPLVAPREPNQDRSFRSRRRAQLRSWATFSTRPLILLLPWLVMLGIARFGWRLLTKEPALARDELAAAFRVALAPGVIRRARRAIASRALVPQSVVAQLYLPASSIRAFRRDRARQIRERAARAAAPSELEVRELAALASRRRRMLALTLLVTAILGFVGTSTIVTSQAVTGGAMATLGDNWARLWDAAWSTWLPSGDGYHAALSPLLALMAGITAFGSLIGLGGDGLVHLLLILALPLAALGAWFAAGTVTRRTTVRAWAALIWATAPALLLALGQGRLAALLVHLLLPWALVATARAVGADRRDAVLSGLVGARRLSQAEQELLDPFSHETRQSLAQLRDDDAPADPQIASRRMERRQELRELAEESEAAAAEHRAADSSTLAAPAAPLPLRQRVQPPSLSDDAADGAVGERGEGDQKHSGGDAVDNDPATPVLDDAPDDVLPATTVHAAAVRSAAIEHYGSGSPTAAAVAGVLFSLIVAASPASALLILPAFAIVFCAARGYRLRVILMMLPVAATASPIFWHTGRIIADMGGAASPAAWYEGLRYLLTDPGLPIAVPDPAGVDLLLGMPMSLASLTSHSAWGTLLRIVFSVTLAVVPLLGALGLFAGGSQGKRARWGLLVAVAGLALAALSVRTVTGIGTSADGATSELATGWAGIGLSFAQAGFLTAAVAGADRARATLVRYHFGWRHITLGVAGLLGMIVPIIIGVTWAGVAARSTGEGNDALTMALKPASQNIPVIAQEMQNSTASARVLVLTSTGDGMSVRLWRGNGTTVIDTAPDVISAQLHSRLADPDELTRPSFRPGTSLAATPAASREVDLAATDAADQSLSDIVARAITGQDDTVAAQLAEHGIGVVLLTNNSGDSGTAVARAGLSATPGLESLAHTAAGSSWRVTPPNAAGTAAQDVGRVGLIEADGSITVLRDPQAIVDGHKDTAALTTRATVAAADTPRILVLAERSGEQWSASIGSVNLEPATAPSGSWRQAFTVPAGVSGTLSLDHGSYPAAVATRVIWAVWALTALACLPLRRRRTLA